MQKVWILEIFRTREKMLEDIEETRSFRTKELTPEQIEFVDKLEAGQQKELDDHPDGYWTGTQGKCIYRQFCEVAKETLRYHLREKNDGSRFRVVKAEIADDAKYWPGYVNAVENEGVLRYLLATM
jgi:hypothetical protein